MSVIPSAPGEATGKPVDVLANPVRRHIVDLLANLPHGIDPATSQAGRSGMSAADLAGELGLHVTTVRFHLDQLVAAGMLGAWFERRESAGRPRKLYGIESHPIDSVSSRHHYELLSGLLVDSLTPGADGTQRSAEQVGADWAMRHMRDDLHLEGSDLAPRPATSAGQWLSRIGRMLDLLSEWGYTPEISTSNRGRTASVHLQDCPFIELAHDNPAVVCGIHRGLIRGAMTALGETETQVGLTPFVEPNRCLASLTTTAPFESPVPRSPLPDKETHV